MHYVFRLIICLISLDNFTQNGINLSQMSKQLKFYGETAKFRAHPHTQVVPAL